MKNSLKSVRLDDELLKKLKPIMKKKHINFSGAVSDALEEYVRSQEFIDTVEEVRGGWKKENHPETTEEYIRKMRKGRKF